MIRVPSLLLAAGVLVACGDAPTTGLDKVLPAVPDGDGSPRTAYAGAITDASNLIPGPAQSGRIGDYYIRNDKIRFVVQAPGRVIGIVPWGGNVIDAATLTGEDHLGEVSMVYVLGRTCAHDQIEVLRDGSGGGPAVLRARGKSAINNLVNLRGTGYFPITDDLNPDIEDKVECATTYTLAPGSDTLEVAWTLYNDGETEIRGAFGALDDVGGEINVFAPGLGFNTGGGIDTVIGSDVPSVPYSVYQGPGIAYGIIPRLQSPAAGNVGLVFAGAAVLVYGIDKPLDVFSSDKGYLRLPAHSGLTHRLDIVVGRDAGATERAYRRVLGTPTVTVSGQVAYTPTGVATRDARVSCFADTDGNGTLSGNDRPVTYFDTDAQGAWSGALPAGTYLLRAEVPDLARSAAQLVTVGEAPVVVPTFQLAEPGLLDYTVLDADQPEAGPIPARITVIGHDPVAPDTSVSRTRDRLFGVVGMVHSARGTSMPAGNEEPDPLLRLAAGGPYRVIATRGPEWSSDSAVIQVSPGQRQALTLRLRRVVDTTGYVATAFHEHTINSPDSIIPLADRVRSLLVEGIEFFAITDHDVHSDPDPYIDQLGVREYMDGVVGVEATPFTYGHFIAYPVDLDPQDPVGGAIDWTDGPGGYAMLPGELWDALRDRVHAKIIQVCHPRNLGFATFQGYFQRAGLVFDFVARTISGAAEKQEVPSDWLRLPTDQSLYSDRFDVLEVFNNLAQADTNSDGEIEFMLLDWVLQDWMNFLSMGKLATPLGNADTHGLESAPAGIPRSLVRVSDDSSAALRRGLDDDVWATLLGQTPRDVIVTNGPFLQVRHGGEPALGHLLAANAGVATLDIEARSPDWMDFDTIEIFANQTYDPVVNNRTVLTPLVCYTSRPIASLHAQDPCRLAPLGGARPLTVAVTNGLRHAELSVTLSAADIPVRAGATGQDAWVVVRVRGHRATYPMTIDGAVTPATLDALLTGEPVAVAAALNGTGTTASAFTAPVLIDFDGNGWRAPFAP